MKHWIQHHSTNLLSLLIYIILFALATSWVVYGIHHLGNWIAWIR